MRTRVGGMQVRLPPHARHGRLVGMRRRPSSLCCAHLDRPQHAIPNLSSTTRLHLSTPSFSCGGHAAAQCLSRATSPHRLHAQPQPHLKRNQVQEGAVQLALGALREGAGGTSERVFSLSSKPPCNATLHACALLLARLAAAGPMQGRRPARGRGVAEPVPHDDGHRGSPQRTAPLLPAAHKPTLTLRVMPLAPIFTVVPLGTGMGFAPMRDSRATTLRRATRTTPARAVPGAKAF